MLTAFCNFVSLLSGRCGKVKVFLCSFRVFSLFRIKIYFPHCFALTIDSWNGFLWPKLSALTINCVQKRLCSEIPFSGNAIPYQKPTEMVAYWWVTPMRVWISFYLHSISFEWLAHWIATYRLQLKWLNYEIMGQLKWWTKLTVSAASCFHVLVSLFKSAAICFCSLGCVDYGFRNWYK